MFSSLWKRVGAGTTAEGTSGSGDESRSSTSCCRAHGSSRQCGGGGSGEDLRGG